MRDRSIHGPQHTPKRSWRVLAALLLAFTLVSPARAGDWTTGDTIAQGVFTGLLYIDYRQSRYAIKHPELGYQEANPILGKTPSVGQLNVYMGAAAVGHAAIAYLLPPKWRDPWQYVWIGAELNAIRVNYAVGIRVLF